MAAERVYWVYVIEFDAPWVENKRAGTVYVGSTGRTPEQRLETHRAGGQTAAAVFKKGRAKRGVRLRLRQDLARVHPSHEGPWPTREEAMVHERKLANRLKGTFVVHVGLGTPRFASRVRDVELRADEHGRVAPGDSR
ncbi:GIY-YIG nuclease family protein [Janibacter melonis]|uniref:GIY-YIG nuclease family protein n=1 Tax=Janibacter melonis TaxID=262209 RepID=UPI00174DE5D9|nr:GIY-YIG nuclease family protein [Janibacter melonis]